MKHIKRQRLAQTSGNNGKVLVNALWGLGLTAMYSTTVSAESACAEAERLAREAADQCTRDSYVCKPGDEELVNCGGFDPVVKRYQRGAGWEACLYFGCDGRQCNFNGGIGPVTPRPEECGGADQPRAAARVEKPHLSCGSIIQVDNQVVGETIPLVGANFGLNYVSSRVFGRRNDYIIKTPIKKLDPSSQIIGYDITIWGNDPDSPLHQASYSGGDDAIDRYEWRGREALDPRHFSVEVVEKYPTLTIPSTNLVNVGTFIAKRYGVGGWTPAVLHYYAVAIQTLYRGDGSLRAVEAKQINPRSCGKDVCYDLQVAEQDGSRVYEFDANGRHLRTRSGLTGSTLFRFNYNADGTLSRITEPFQRVTAFQRDSAGNLAAIVAPYGQTTGVELDGNGYLARVTDPQNQVYQIGYYGKGGLLKSFITPTRRVSTFTYDSDGNLLTDTHSGGRLASITSRDERLGSGKTLTTKEGRTTLFHSSFNPETRNPQPEDGVFERTTTYPSGEQVTFSDQAGKSHYSDADLDVTYSYQDDPRFGKMARLPTRLDWGGTSFYYLNEIELADADDPFSIIRWTNTAHSGNSLSARKYDGSTRTYTTTSKLGRTSRLRIDALERPLFKSQGNLLPIFLNYTKDHLTEITQGTRKTKLVYETDTGLLSAVTGPLNRTVSFVYDAAQRVTEQILPDGRVIQFGYDKAGHLVSVTPPTRPKHRLGINAKDLLGAYKPPPLTDVLQSATRYSYNDDDQLIRIQRPDGASVLLAYDELSGLLGTITTPRGDFTVTHKPNSGLIDSITTPDKGKLAIDYREKQVREYRWFDSNDKRVGSYNRYFFRSLHGKYLVSSDNVYSTNYENVGISYAYDDDGFPKQIGDMALNYSVPNGLLSVTRLGRLKDNYSYSAYGELKTFRSGKGTTPYYSMELIRDDLGRVTEKLEFLSGYGTQRYSYSYDTAGRLSRVKKNNISVASYVYDDNGNRISGKFGGQPFTAEYDNQDRLQQQNALKLTYNANGDLIGKTDTASGAVTAYDYDVFGNLRRVLLPKGGRIDYEIDGLNRRVGKIVNGKLKVRYLYQDRLRIAAELYPDGSLKRRYVYATGRTTPDYYIQDGIQYKIISDYLGSPRAVVRVSNNKIIYRMDHDEFGRVTFDSKPGFLPFGFAGGLYEPTTGLVRFGARDYDPETGRWTAKDPIKLKDGPNLYSYVKNNPLNFVDPYGQEAKTPVFSPAVKELVNQGAPASLPESEGNGNEELYPRPSWSRLKQSPSQGEPCEEEEFDEGAPASQPTLIHGSF